MLGTAFPAARLLLVEQALPWGPEGLRTSRFESATALALEERCRTDGVRVQAIRRVERTPHRARRRWALVDTRESSGTLRWGEFGDDAELLDMPLDGSLGEEDPDPIYLVCTHGKHDPCCASHGRPTAAALEAARPGRVWHTSHLGGCRFAATVLVLPFGLMYGRVPPSEVTEFVAAAEEGEVATAMLRGRIGLRPVAQAAIGFAHEQLALPRHGDVSLVSMTSVDRGTVLVRVRSSRGLFDVTVEQERVDAAGLTCAAPGPNWFMAHRPVAIEPADTGADGDR